MKMSRRTTTKTTKEVRIEIDEETLLEMLRERFVLPDNAEVAMHIWIPGGGDWSNTKLEVSESPIIVKWTTVEETEE